MRRDWWRLWICTRTAPAYTHGAISVVLTIAGREYAIGFRTTKETL